MRRGENNIVKSVIEWKPLERNIGVNLGKSESIQSKKVLVAQLCFGGKYS